MAVPGRPADAGAENTVHDDGRGTQHGVQRSRILSESIVLLERGIPATQKILPISVGHETRAPLALLGTGFLPDASVRAEQGRVLAALLPRVRDVRRSGSAALDLVSVASGTLDVYFEFGLGAWDIAGGAAIAEAAGARVLELTPTVLPPPLVVAGNAALVEALSVLLIEAGAARA